jgi:hypothetical protein
VQVCRFNAPRRGVLDPGDSVTGLGIASAWLPGIASVTFRGLGGFDSIPTAENTPDSVHALVRWVHGTGRTLAMVLPVRPPQTVADGRTALMAVISDLATTCAESQWIDDTGICRSLQAKLTAASAALSREQFPTSRNQLSAFRAELDAQRGKHVNENAYFLLRVLADHAMSLLH